MRRGPKSGVEGLPWVETPVEFGLMNPFGHLKYSRYRAQASSSGNKRCDHQDQFILLDMR